MRDKVEFQKNVAQEVALAYANGREGSNDNGAYYLYTTVDDRIFFATPTLNQKIQSLAPRAHERIEITLRCDRSTGGKNQWDVRRVEPEDDRGVEAPAVQVANITTSNGHANGSSNGKEHANGNGHGSVATAVAPAPAPAPAGLMTGQSQFILQQLIAAIEAVAAAEKYSAMMGRPVSFSSEDIRCFAISCFIQQSRGGR